MRKLVLIAITMVLLLVIAGTGQALRHHPKLKMYSDKRYYDIGEPVTLYAENTGKKPINLAHHFCYTHTKIYFQDGSLIYWSPKVCEVGTTLYPGDIESWEWDQTYATWVQELNEFGYHMWVKAPNYGEQVPEGRYIAYQYNVGSTVFWIGHPDYPGASDSNRQDYGQGDACLDWASNEHSQGREHAADS